MSADRPNTDSHGKSLRNMPDTHSLYETGPRKVRHPDAPSPERRNLNRPLHDSTCAHRH